MTYRFDGRHSDEPPDAWEPPTVTEVPARCPWCSLASVALDDHGRVEWAGAVPRLVAVVYCVTPGCGWVRAYSRR